MHDETFYASVASIGDKAAVSQDMGRATVLLGWERYRRFNPKEELIWLDDAEGKPRALTTRQYKVLTLALAMIEGTSRLTMRDMATALQVAPSTVSRALTKLASWGLIAYVVGRGRWAGLVIFRRAKDDGMDRFREAAKARVRRWSQAARDRVSRLEFNVASYFLGREASPARDYYLTTKYMDATLTAQRPWTVEELRDAGII
jgi:DNA-binding transcriptional regulator YhcF (GntR family)